jgi:hypothetical protein
MTREERLAYLRKYAQQYRQTNKATIKAKRQLKTIYDREATAKIAAQRQAIKDEIRATKMAIIARRQPTT